MGSGHSGRAIDNQATNLYLATAAVNRNRLAVKQNVKDVFSNPRNSGVFVVHTGDTDCGDRTAFKATDQDAP
jgi:hypothetical protein